jgi:hypothetical protein
MVLLWTPPTLAASETESQIGFKIFSSLTMGIELMGLKDWH